MTREVMKLTKLCVFDLDGTLINSLTDLAESTNYALSKNGFDIYPVDKYKYLVGDGVQMLMKRALNMSGTPEMEAALLKDFNEYYNRHYSDHTTAYDGINELLSAIAQRGIACAVLSNKPDNFVKIIVNKIFADFKFAWIQGKTEKFPPKPDPSSLKFILNKLNVNTNDVLYAGDSDVDVKTGKNAGVKTCGVLWGFRTREELETAGADNIASVPSDILYML